MAAPQSDGYLIVEYLPLFEAGDIFDGRGRDVFQCFLREERLVACDEDTWKCKQARKHVVGNDWTGAIFEKDLFLFFVNIETELADFASAEDGHFHLQIHA